MGKLHFFLVLLLFSSISPLRAAVYYVATNGNDLNAGTTGAAPFATLNRTNDFVQPGDTVYVRGGVYNQRVGLWKSGTSASARITYRAYGTERVILDGTGILDNGQPADLVTLGGSWVDWIGFEIRNSTRIGLVTWEAHDQRILDNTIYGSAGNGYTADWDLAGTVFNILFARNRVHNNVLDNRGQNASEGWGQAVGFNGASNVTVTENLVYRNYGEGIFIGSTTGSRIAHNEVFDNYAANIYLSHARSCVVDGNLVYSTRDPNYYRGGHPAKGILLANEMNNSNPNGTYAVDVINNVVLRAEWGIGFWSDERETLVHGMPNSRFANNTVYDPTRHALHIDPDANLTEVYVENNIFAVPAGSSATLQSVPPAPTTITYRYNNWSSHPGAPVYHSIYDRTGDPQFVFPGGTNAEDYKLTPTSPGRNAGRTLTFVPKDYWLKTRATAWDMGAHEY